VFASSEVAAGLPAAMKAAGLSTTTLGYAPQTGTLQDIKDGGMTAGLAVGARGRAVGGGAGGGVGWRPGLNEPALIVNWMWLPTGAGQLAHLLSSPFLDVRSQPFIDVFRLLGAGLFGLLMGHGFAGGLGGFASILGLMLQIGIIALVGYLIWTWWQRRQQPALASGPMLRDYNSGNSGSPMGFGGGPSRPAPPLSGTVMLPRQVE